MRRYSKDSVPAYVKHDITDLGLDRLAYIGAVCLTWNAIEEDVDDCVALGLEILAPIECDVISRINGLDGKIAILKACAEKSFLMPIERLNPLRQTMGFVAEHKKYRDAVIHARIHDPNSPVMASFLNKGRRVEVVFTKEALSILFRRLCYCQAELHCVWHVLYHCRNIRNRMVKVLSKDEKLQAEQEAQSALAQLLDLQSQRKSLPPLPEFPEQPQDLKETEENQ